MISWKTVALGLAVLTVAATTQAQVITKKALTLDGAKKIAAAAEAEAKKKNAKVVIAVVDDGGSLILLERLDDTQVASVDVGIGKARTAAIFRRPSKVFEDQIRDGRIAALGLVGATPLQGGIPILFEGKVIGAIGVSGETPSLDEEIAIAGASALTARATGSAGTQSSSAVTYIDSKKMAEAFSKGAVLIGNGEYMMHATRNYMVHASRRDKPGMAEIHTWETDVIYVLEGSATFVTGGTLVDAKTTEPGQIRGPSIQGGETRRLAKGDVIIIPNGVPHWFKEVQGPLLYFVVKPISPAGEGK